jgi:osmotically-inducible protein OsmY
MNSMAQILQFERLAPATSVVEAAERQLRQSPYFFLKGLSCHFDGGVLTLRGTVPMWQLRQFAETIVGRVEGVRQVVNQVEIFDPMLMPLGDRAARNAG